MILEKNLNKQKIFSSCSRVIYFFLLTGSISSSSWNYISINMGYSILTIFMTFGAHTLNF